MGPSSRRIARLNLDNLDDLPGRCRSCTFWELDPVSRARTPDAGAAAGAKEDWVSRVLLEWGSCGRVAYVDDAPAGYALFAPASFVPGAAAFPTAPVSDDAILLTTVHVRPEYAAAGLGRLLVQAVVKDAVNRGGIRAIEAFGRDAPLPGHGCVVPTDFLLRVGFKTHRPHPVHPRLRMDMRSVLTWREEVEGALERLFEAVRPRPVAPSTKRSGAVPPG